MDNYTSIKNQEKREREKDKKEGRMKKSTRCTSGMLCYLYMMFVRL